jgi:Gpi18-like mannosyltransferase
MNYKIIFQLSLLGLAMAIATVFWIPSNTEPIFWLVIFIISAYFIALKSSGKYFKTGFWVSICNCIWITTAHIIFFHTYIANHPQQADMMAKIPFHESPRLMMLITGPVIGIVSGIVLGLFAYIASRILQKK